MVTERKVIMDLLRALSYADKHCEAVHHPKQLQHDYDQPCPIELIIKTATSQAEEYLRKMGK